MKLWLLVATLFLSFCLSCKRTAGFDHDRCGKKPRLCDQDMLEPAITPVSVITFDYLKALRSSVPEAPWMKHIILATSEADWRRLLLVLQKNRHLWLVLGELTFDEAEASHVLGCMSHQSPHLLSGLLAIFKAFPECYDNSQFMQLVAACLARSVEGTHHLLSRGLFKVCFDQFDQHCQKHLHLEGHMEAINARPRSLLSLLETMKAVLEAMVDYQCESVGFPINLLATLCFMSASDLVRLPFDPAFFTPTELSIMEHHLDAFFDVLSPPELLTICRAPNLASPFARVLVRCLIRRHEDLSALFSELKLDPRKVLSHFVGAEAADSAEALMFRLQDTIIEEDLCGHFSRVNM